MDAPVSTEVAASPTHSALEESQDVLLSKPANPEQIRIAQYTETMGGILVQGPPGTGKTHTIGNLIGHLLARGKSVLVTSHTTKALRMVRSQVVSKLRSLCVSVLESDLDSRKQLESAVGTIAERLSQADGKTLEIEATQLSKQRAELQEKLADLQQRLADARADEYRAIIVGGKSWAPSDAARWVAKEVNHGWVPSPVALGAAMPLSEGEVAELYSTNRSVPADVERELSQPLPDATDLPSPAEFETLTNTKIHLSEVDREFRADLWQTAPSTPSPESLSTIVPKLESAIAPLNGRERWKLAAVYAGKNGGPHREPWDNLVTFIDEVHVEVAKSQDVLLRYAPSLNPGFSLEDQEKTAVEIHTHLRENGSLGFLTLFTQKAWKQLIQTVSVNGSQPKLPEHFLAISLLCRVKLMRRDLSARWDRQMTPLGASSSRAMGDEIEKSAVQFCEPIRDCLAWSSRTWGPLEKELKQVGFFWEKFMSEQPAVVGADGELRRLQQTVSTSLLPILAARIDYLLWERNELLLGGLRDRLSLAKRVAADALVVADLYDSVVACDPEAYRTSYARLMEIQSLRSELVRRKELLARLEAAAPAWAAAIRTRAEVHGAPSQPGNPIEAWTWRQLHDELERRASVSLEDIQDAID